MRRCLFVLAWPLLLVPQPASAWGPEGHVIVARIADLNLNDAARAQVKALLDGRSMANTRNANWADYIKRSAQYRDKYPNSSAYHYVDIPVDTSKYEPEKLCKDGACIIDSIERFRKVLADPKADETDRKEALLFLIHLVGDLHQPLHCAERKGDRGGNLYPVRYLGNAEKNLNLHKVWDMHLVRDHLGDLEPWDRAGRLNEDIKKEEREAWRKGTVEDWALESHNLAKDVVYKDVPEDKRDASPPVDLDEKYMERARPVVAEQLKKGGIRLARILNEALAP